MISKAHNNNSFKATIGYLLGKEKAFVLDKDELVGITPKQQIREMVLTAQESKRTKKPVYHLSLAVHPEDKGKLTDKDFKDIAKEYLKKLGLEGCQYLLIKHQDTEHEHVHLVVNRVKDGKAINMSHDKRKCVELDREIEKKYGLVIAPLAQRQEKDINKDEKLSCEVENSKKFKEEQQKQKDNLYIGNNDRQKFMEYEDKNIAKHFRREMVKTAISYYKNKPIYVDIENNPFHKELEDMRKEIQIKRGKTFDELKQWREKAKEVREICNQIGTIKKESLEVRNEFWKNYREKASERDKLAKKCLDSKVISISVTDKTFATLEKHANKSHLLPEERRNHYVNKFKRWLRTARKEVKLRREIKENKYYDRKKALSNLDKLRKTRNKLAHELVKDKEQFKNIVLLYQKTLKNQSLDYEREQQQEKSHRHYKEKELTKGMDYNSPNLDI